MTYDDLKKSIATHQRTITALKDQIPSKKVRDKVGMYFRFNKLISDGHWRHAIIQFDAHHGSYGSSSAYDDMSEELAKAVVAALNSYKQAIIVEAVALLEEALAQKAAKAASEAEQILELAKAAGGKADQHSYELVKEGRVAIAKAEGERDND